MARFGFAMKESREQTRIGALKKVNEWRFIERLVMRTLDWLIPGTLELNSRRKTKAFRWRMDRARTARSRRLSPASELCRSRIAWVSCTRRSGSSTWLLFLARADLNIHLDRMDRDRRFCSTSTLCWAALLRAGIYTRHDQSHRLKSGWAPSSRGTDSRAWRSWSIPSVADSKDAAIR